MNKKLTIGLALTFILSSKMTCAESSYVIMDEITPAAISHHEYPKIISDKLIEIKAMLYRQSNRLHTAVIRKVLRILQSSSYLESEPMLTIIDFSLPSNQKRLWVFDMQTKRLLYNTYVSHGIKSGVLLSNYFSNKHDSKASSMGVFKTDKSYYGRHGLSLKLDGLEYGFNDNADSRAVVMHGGWYVDEDFIKKYGRAGRSWGCPAVPSNLTQSIINTIKERSVLVAYYPSERWFAKSRFLKLNSFITKYNDSGINQSIEEIEQRDDILFADRHNSSDSGPILVMPADCYTRVFHSKAPLTRMLRRQINNQEYIALNGTELQNLNTENDANINPTDKNLYFAVAEVKMERGYYATEMKLSSLGIVKEVKLSSNTDNSQHYVVNFIDKPSLEVTSSNRFIRWVGL